MAPDHGARGPSVGDWGAASGCQSDRCKISHPAGVDVLQVSSLADELSGVSAVGFAFNEQSCGVGDQADQSAGEGDGEILGEGDERGCVAAASRLPE